jgi:hypothetical protein
MYAINTAAFTGLFLDTNTNAALFTYDTNFGMNGIQITEGILTCSISSNPTTTTTLSSMIVTITPKIMIPYNTTITIIMQKYWPMNAVNITPILSAVSCQSGINTSSTIQCSLIVTSTNLQISVTNVVSADTYSGIQFYINTIINPPTI